MILPVDPMIWNRTASELLLSVSEGGDLEFWAAEAGTSWKRTGHVATGRKEIIKGRCSSAKKTVLVVRRPDGDEVSIWDSKESQFSSGLEHSQIFPYVHQIRSFTMSQISKEPTLPWSIWIGPPPLTDNLSWL
ncbi:regulator of (H+)-ATPase in vacuolar membrane [Serendipita sp. 400]|nr:regulator of (H+)-ATPase in vacuolar membrane [Serendipita sp. 400]